MAEFDDLRKLEIVLAQRDALRGALAAIHNSTEPDAIKHRDYDHLASDIYGVCKAALDGEFVDDMHAAEVYDTLYPRHPVVAPGDRGNG